MIIDAHTHVQFPQFDKDRDEVIRRALDNGIWMINAGSDKQNSKQAVELADKYEEGVYATVGQHPSEAEGFSAKGGPALGWDYEFFRNLAKNPNVVAIGECGLDYAVFARKRSERLQKRASAEVINEGGLLKEKQKLIFTKHIELAAEIKKPLMIHCREAHSANSGQAFSNLIEILNSQSSLLNPIPGVLHFFTGTLENTKQLLELGFYFTFGGLITFNRDFDEVIKFLPLEKILLETDAPYVSPEPYRGKRNEPAYITEVVKKLAEIKGLTYEKVAKATTENAIKIFSLSNLT